MTEVCKTYLRKTKQTQAILDTWSKGAHAAIDSLFREELAEFEVEVRKWATLKRATPQVRVQGGAMYITHPGIINQYGQMEPSVQLTFVPRPLVFLRISQITLADCRGATKTWRTSKHRGQADLSPEERLEQTVNMIAETRGQEVADHLRKVLAGEVGLMEKGPRGYSTVREWMFGDIMRRERRHRREFFRFLAAFSPTA